MPVRSTTLFSRNRCVVPVVSVFVNAVDMAGCCSGISNLRWVLLWREFVGAKIESYVMIEQ
jgi:hypothetical protein